MTPDDIEVDEDGTVALEDAYFWLGKFPPNVWKDSSGLWHARIPAGDSYTTERDRAKALISKARDLDYVLTYERERTGDGAYNPPVSLEQAGPGETNVWTEYP